MPLNSQHETFARAYVSGATAGNLAGSYAAAGYRRHRANAARLAAQPEIRRRIDDLKRQQKEAERLAAHAAMRDLAIDRRGVWGEMRSIAFANVLDYVAVDADGAVRFDLAKLDRAKGSAIRDLWFETEDLPDGRQKIKRMRVRLFDKSAVLKQFAGELELAELVAPDDPQAAEDLDANSEEEIIEQMADSLRGFYGVQDLFARVFGVRREAIADVVDAAAKESAFAGKGADVAVAARSSPPSSGVPSRTARSPRAPRPTAKQVALHSPTPSDGLAAKDPLPPQAQPPAAPAPPPAPAVEDPPLIQRDRDDFPPTPGASVLRLLQERGRGGT